MPALDQLAGDTDGDGLSDFDEVVTYATDPLLSNRGDLATRGASDGNINAGDYLVLSRLLDIMSSPDSMPVKERLPDLHQPDSSSAAHRFR